jgi:hypothetical protein
MKFYKTGQPKTIAIVSQTPPLLLGSVCHAVKHPINKYIVTKKIINFFINYIILVLREGIEPSIPCGPGILSPMRMPVPPPELIGGVKRS